MNPRLETRLASLVERREEVERLLAAPEVADDPTRLTTLSREYSRLEPVASVLAARQRAQSELEQAETLQQESADPEFAAMAAEEIDRARSEIEALEAELGLLLVPRDERDDSNLFLEIRAGTGGDEAAIFAGDLLRMYLRYAETRGWQTELVSAQSGEHGGYREVIARFAGDQAFARMKFESGTHRVQRVPQTESQGRIHTSAATVAILPELDAIATVELDPSELRIDTYRSSGAGGQHVNKTDSAIRITHLPTGTVVECQDERSQHKNRARAMSLLQARLTDSQRNEQNRAQAENRRLQVGSGDRSERIRTWNFPQGRVTDHRIGLTLYRLDEMLAGDLDELLDALARENQADLLAALDNS